MERSLILWRAALRALDRFVQSPARVMAAVGLLAMSLGVTVSLLGNIPVPSAHDEFSYLLAADTFAHGRLTNPPHPMWKHFESFHIIQQPTYASKYPVGQGLALALGQVTVGLPIAGVWLSIALASAAVSWMLYGWVSPRWALAGGFLTAMNPQVMRWGHNYWGGGVALLGGALVLGAARRLAVPKPLPRDAVPLAIGLAVLANSRPFEGLVLSVVVLGMLLLWHVKQAASLTVVAGRVRSVLLPVVVILGLTAASMGYYNFRVTGDPLQLPYMVHEATYVPGRIFPWQERRSVTYRHEVMRAFWGPRPDRSTPHEANPTGMGRLRELARQRLDSVGIMFESMAFNRGLLLAMLILPWSLWRDRWSRVACTALVVSIAGILVGSWFLIHYAAPMVPLVVAIAVRAMSQASAFRSGRALVLLVALLSVDASADEVRILVSRDERNATRWSAQRSRLRASLLQEGGKHLVFVRYGPGHVADAEWVYNAADIDAAPVVWAREMTATENRSLLNYFGDRRVWFVEADTQPWRLQPYEPPAR